MVKQGSMKSIIQDEKVCLVCGSTNTHEHHCWGGTANRKLSEKYGLKVYLCPYHHNMSDNGVHFDKELDNEIKELAKKKFEQTYNLNFQRLFYGDGIEEEL